MANGGITEDGLLGGTEKSATVRGRQPLTILAVAGVILAISLAAFLASALVQSGGRTITLSEGETYATLRLNTVNPFWVLVDGEEGPVVPRHFWNRAVPIAGRVPVGCNADGILLFSFGKLAVFAIVEAHWVWCYAICFHAPKPDVLATAVGSPLPAYP
jgi:hypothetical protein